MTLIGINDLCCRCLASWFILKVKVIGRSSRSREKYVAQVFCDTSDEGFLVLQIQCLIDCVLPGCAGASSYSQHSFSSLYSRTAMKILFTFWVSVKQEIMGWQWHQRYHMQLVCISLQTQLYQCCITQLTGQMLFLTPDQQSQHYRQYSNNKNNNNLFSGFSSKAYTIRINHSWFSEARDDGMTVALVGPY